MQDIPSSTHSIVKGKQTALQLRTREGGRGGYKVFDAHCSVLLNTIPQELCFYHTLLALHLRPF